MQITIHNTDKIIMVNGAQCRVWEGKTETGIPVTAFMPLIAVNDSEDQTQFEKELKEVHPASDTVNDFPLNMII